MNHLFLVAFLISFSFYGLSQNLIPNPSFEDYIECPDDIKQLSRALYWESANAGTPEYFNLCGYHDDVRPLDGNGYAGLIFLDDYRSMVEYLSIKLLEPLQKDSLYCLEFFVASSKLNPTVTDKIGAVLSTEKIETPLWKPFIRSPQLKSDEVIREDGIWESVKGVVKAKGQEQYLTLGNFYEAYYLNEQRTYFNTEQVYTYYYFDKLSLFKSNETCSFSEHSVDVLSEIESELVLYFDLDNYHLSDIELEKLSWFLIQLESTKTKQLKIEGHTDTLGNKAYNILLAQQRASFVSELVDSLSNFSNYTIWFGEQKPLSSPELSKDEANAKNRRVKVYAID